MFLNVLLPVHLPLPPDSVIVPVDVVPSPHAIVHVCVSALPASVKDAVTETVAPALKIVPPSGLVIVTTGAAFATVAARVFAADTPVASVTVTVTVYGVERSLTYACAAESAPCAVAVYVVFAVPSPQSTVSV